ncbi:reticulon-like protein B8 [Cryptomeria japonica]|uniref:reticulon-like protein B8 n=1 Tax=Cryptomeria japonica TaxID=3369 RepID=UPI0025AC911F|nr:reticulon-like protein B8 [Cryptomeria japonica]XP_057864546.1 reticulon-like protein B8 [Cryptomeria japonica]
MPEHSRRVSAENLLDNFMETFAHNVPKKSSEPVFESTEKSTVSDSFNRLFGREKPVHHLLGGGKSADVLLWRNKRISGSVLAGATFTWLLFEWLNYHMLTLICIGLVLSMTILFLWSNAANILNRSAPSFPRISLPEDIFVTAAIALSNEINRFLSFLQDVASGKDLKTFLVVAGSLFAVAIIGSWCNFLTIFYIGFVAAHTLPVLYEKYGDQIDSCIYDALDKTKQNYRRFDSQVLRRIPTMKGKKSQ